MPQNEGSSNDPVLVQDDHYLTDFNLSETDE